MEVLDLSLLRPYKALPFDLYHISGNILLKRGTPMTANDLEVFKNAGIGKVFALSRGDSVRDFRRSREYRSLPVEELPRGTPLPRSLVIGEKEIASAGAPITDEMIAELKENGMDSILVKRSAAEMQLDSYQQVMTQLAGYAGSEAVEKEILEIFEDPGQDEGTYLDDEPTQVLPVEKDGPALKVLEKPAQKPRPEPKRVSREEIEEKLVIKRTQLTSDPRWSSEVSIQKVLALGGATVRPSGEPLLGQMAEIDPRDSRPEASRRHAIEEFESCLLDLNRVFDLLVGGDVIEGDLLSALARKLIARYAEDPSLALNLVNLPVTGEPLLRHSLDSCLVAVATGAQLGYSADQVLEIAFGALMHDIGMYKISEDIRNKPGELDPAEWGEIREHPVYNLSIIRQIKSIPKSAPILAYQVHERTDRSGYPLHQPPEMIHTYAKIVGIADMFTAMIKSRPYREAMSPVDAVEEIVRQTAKNKLDIDTVRAFLFAVCYFPVGSMVRLSDGRTAKVVRPSLEDYTRPYVAIIDESSPGSPALDFVNLAEDLEIGIVEGLKSAPADKEQLLAGF